MSEPIDISEARRRLNTIDKTLATQPMIYVARHGKVVFAFVEAEFLQAMIDTIAIMRNPSFNRMFHNILEERRLHNHEAVRGEILEGKR